ncbi:MAG: hypothetical protein GXO94_00690 [Nitrospirae bacterium]|nr:hypothetical protein [Nitrospirota bacterium]
MADARDCGMERPVCLILLLCAFIVLPFSGCGQKEPEADSPFGKTVNTEIVQLTPRKPVRIVLKRTSKGVYTWELRGDDLEGIIDADKRLRRYVYEGGGTEEARAGQDRSEK